MFIFVFADKDLQVYSTLIHTYWKTLALKHKQSGAFQEDLLFNADQD